MQLYILKIPDRYLLFRYVNKRELTNVYKFEFADYLLLFIFAVTDVDLHMNTRLQLFLSSENLSQSQFADKIGVARASITHIISGRNKPGFDFISNMAIAFPDLNLDWLVTGKGSMYKTSSDKSSEVIPSDMPSKADKKTDSGHIEMSDPADLFSFEPEVGTDTGAKPEDRKQPARPSPFRKAAHYSDSGPSTGYEVSNAGVPSLKSENCQVFNSKSVSKVIVFFSDGTFQELKKT